MAKVFFRKIRLSLAFFLILFIFLFAQCSSPKSNIPPAKYTITEAERVWIKNFFRCLLFENMGAYVLYGSKPVSISCIEEPLSEEEKAEWNAYFDSLSEEEKRKIEFVKKKYCDYADDYKKLEEIKLKLPINQYLFGRFPCKSSDKVDFALFINIEMTLRILLEYYEDFRRVLGYDFDPFQVVFEVENRDSKFWNRIMSNHALVGILLGYGRDNAWFFEWKMKNKKSEGRLGNFVRSLPSIVYEERDIDDPTPSDFTLPIFGSYGLYPNDKQLFRQYEIEHEKIKALYRGKDEVDIALEWLTR